MVVIEKETVGNIPLLHVVAEQKRNDKLPLIIFIHGFESIKERNVQYAYMLADKGYRVLLPEAIEHGERAASQVNAANFWKIVLTTIHELPLIKNAYAEKGLVDENRIGVAGSSMGAIITLGAMMQYNWIHTGVSLMGTPAYMEFARYQMKMMEHQGMKLPFSEEQVEEQLAMLRLYDAAAHIDQFEARPLLFWHGAKDVMVPYKQAYAFYEQLQERYMKENVPLSFIIDEQAGHNVPNKGVVETVNWFVNYL